MDTAIVNNAMQSSDENQRASHFNELRVSPLSKDKELLQGNSNSTHFSDGARKLNVGIANQPLSNVQHKAQEIERQHQTQTTSHYNAWKKPLRLRFEPSPNDPFPD